MSQDAERAKSYFDALAPEYDRAFRMQGRSALNALVNRTFRGKTFAIRMRRLEALFREIGMEGKTVLDLGCGSGQVSLLAASMGARVHGIDIAPRMLAIARESAAHAGLADRVTFTEGDASTASLDSADIVMLIGVIEYYEKMPALVARAAAAAKERLLVAHTQRVAYRMLLRKILFALDGSNLYFHPMPDVVAAGQAAGMPLEREIREHAFSILNFSRS